MDPGSQPFQPNSSSKVRFQNPPSETIPSKEKPPKKTYLEKALAKEYPGVEDRLANRILTEQVMSIPVGELLAVSPGVTESMRKKISNRRVPLEGKTTNAGDLEETEEDNQESSPHYSCRLGYVKLNINGENHQALLDTGSMVNVIPATLAHQLGLVITQKPMKLRGIGGHHTAVTGIAEKVEVYIGSILKHIHFWVTEGPVQLILGKPFFNDASATMDHTSGLGERLIIKDRGQQFLVPIAYHKHHKNETSLPANSATSSFLGQEQDFSFSS